MNKRVLAGFRVENVRHPPRPEQVDQAVQLWLAEQVLTEAEAKRRASELLLVAIEDNSDRLVGICTTYLATPPTLRMPLWHFRTFVEPRYREKDVAFHLLHGARDFHQEQFVSGADTRGRGLYMEIENPVIQKYRNEAVWPSSRMTFVGYNARGDHCRVFYFPGVRVSS